MLYHGSQKERMDLVKKIRKPQGSLHMCPVVVTSFEIAMIDRKYLQVRNDSCTPVNAIMYNNYDWAVFKREGKGSMFWFGFFLFMKIVVL